MKAIFALFVVALVASGVAADVGDKVVVKSIDSTGNIYLGQQVEITLEAQRADGTPFAFSGSVGVSLNDKLQTVVVFRQQSSVSEVVVEPETEGTNIISFVDVDSSGGMDLSATAEFEAAEGADALQIECPTNALVGSETAISVRAYSGDLPSNRWAGIVGLQIDCGAGAQDAGTVEVEMAADAADGASGSIDYTSAAEADVKCTFSLIDVNSIALDVSDTCDTWFYNDRCAEFECANGGTCRTSPPTDSKDAKAVCDCTSAWTGTQCTVDVNECGGSFSPCTSIPSKPVCNNIDGGYVCNALPAVKAPQQPGQIIDLKTTESYTSFVTSPSKQNEFKENSAAYLQETGNPEFADLSGDDIEIIQILVNTDDDRRAVTDTLNIKFAVQTSATDADENQSKTDVADTSIALDLSNFSVRVFGTSTSVTASAKVANPLPVAPVNMATSISFKDTDRAYGKIAGTVNIGAANNEEDDVEVYQLYFGTSATSPIVSTLVSITATGAASYSHVIPDDTSLNGATHLIVYTANDAARMVVGISLIIQDVDCPEWLVNDEEWAVGASSERSAERSASMTLDNDDGTYWQADTDSDEWIVYDLEDAHIITKFELTPRVDTVDGSGQGKVRNFALQTTEELGVDAPVWTDVVTGEMTEEQGATTYLVASVRARYFRLFVSDTYESGRVAVAGVRFYGKPTRDSRVSLDAGMVSEGFSTQPAAARPTRLPDALVDGDLDSIWEPDTTRDGYVVLDLGAGFVLSGLTLFPLGFNVRRAKLEVAPMASGYTAADEVNDAGVWKVVSSFKVPIDYDESTGVTVAFSPVQARYIRLNLHNSYLNGVNLAARELRVIGYPAESQMLTSDADFASGASSSGGDPSHPERVFTNTVDGSLNTWWQAATDSDEFVTFNLQSPRALSQIKLFSKNTGGGAPGAGSPGPRIHNGRLQKLGSDGAWQTVADFTVTNGVQLTDTDRYVFTVQIDGTSIEDPAGSSRAVLAQYWRLYNVDSYDYRIGVKEVQFYGPERSFERYTTTADMFLAVSSSADPANGGVNTVDGDDGTFWEAASNADEWIVYDMQSEVSVAYMLLELGGANGIQAAMIQSGDPFADEWSTIVEFAVPENEESYTAVFDSSVTSRYFRVFVFSSFDGRNVRLYETRFSQDTTEYCT